MTLQGFDAQQRWPTVSVTVDNQLIYSGTIRGQQQIVYESQAAIDQKTCVLDIEYHGKTDADTVLSSQGNIVENQSVAIQELWVNGVDIIKTGAIHRNIGCYTMNLPANKKQYFIEQGINVEPTTHTHMFENGTWHIELALPLLSTLTGLHNYTEIWEQVDVQSLVSSIYNKLEVCQALEQQKHA